jgi:hypothetical protein
MLFVGIGPQHVISCPSLRETQWKLSGQVQILHSSLRQFLLVPSSLLPSYIPTRLEPHILAQGAVYATQDPSSFSLLMATPTPALLSLSPPSLPCRAQWLFHRLVGG